MEPVTQIAQRQHAERRQSSRRHLCLDAEAMLPGSNIDTVQLHDLSNSGFLMECVTPIGVGERFEIRLAGSVAYPARAIWACGSLVGCEFQNRLSNSACSAALLKARPAKTRPATISWSNGSDLDQGAFASEITPSRKNSRVARLILGVSIALWATLAMAIFLT